MCVLLKRKHAQPWSIVYKNTDYPRTIYSTSSSIPLYLRSSSCTLVSYNQDPKPPETTILLLSQRTQPGLDTPWGSGGRASMTPAFVKIVLGCNLQAGNIMCLTNCQYYLNTVCLNLLTVFVSKNTDLMVTRIYLFPFLLGTGGPKIAHVIPPPPPEP